MHCTCTPCTVDGVWLVLCCLYVCVVHSCVIGWWIRMLWRWWRKGRGARATSTASCPGTSAPPWSTSSNLQNSKLVLRALSLGAALPSKHRSSCIHAHTHTHSGGQCEMLCILHCTLHCVYTCIRTYTCRLLYMQLWHTHTVLYWIIC